MGSFFERPHGRRTRQAAALGILLAACAPAQARTNAGEEKPRQIVTDETGRRVAIPAEVRRIVSLAPNITEILYALGVEDRLVGDTTYCDFPAEAQRKPHVGGPVAPSLESIVGLAPDLVLATASINRPETVEALERLGLAVYATDPHSVQGMILGMSRLATLVGAQAAGASIVDAMEARLDSLKTRLAGTTPRRVLFVVWEDPLISVGQDTFIADALRLAGAESVVKTEQNWPRLSLEEVVHLDPDYLVFTRDHERAQSGEAELPKLRERPGWKDLAAVRNGRVVVVSDAVDKPAPRLIDAIGELALQLHPETQPEAAPAEKQTKPAAPGVKSGASHVRVPAGGVSCGR